ncbi:glycerophosphodiester phosphodiesterase family protein [Geodermatophilus sp. URMC 62]|uniref:glycerophosphodiester phosphodiesterase family protein n=1 Tax=Geodermatophilus sp. URMC 62 TaxID=3423414 RepID=UPI00406D2055
MLGHRGAPSTLRHAENTLQSVRVALDAGADAVEVDVRATGDGASSTGAGSTSTRSSSVAVDGRSRPRTTRPTWSWWRTGRSATGSPCCATPSPGPEPVAGRMSVARRVTGVRPSRRSCSTGRR